MHEGGVHVSARTPCVDRRTYSHNHQEPGKEAAEVQHAGARALDKVIRVGAAGADPVGQRGEDVGADDEEREVAREEGAREDDEQEADGEDKGQGNDGFEAGGRHRGAFCEEQGTDRQGKAAPVRCCWSRLTREGKPGPKGKGARRRRRREEDGKRP